SLHHAGTGRDMACCLRHTRRPARIAHQPCRNDKRRHHSYGAAARGACAAACRHGHLYGSAETYRRGLSRLDRHCLLSRTDHGPCYSRTGDARQQGAAFPPRLSHRCHQSEAAHLLCGLLSAIHQSVRACRAAALSSGCHFRCGGRSLRWHLCARGRTARALSEGAARAAHQQPHYRHGAHCIRGSARPCKTLDWTQRKTICRRVPAGETGDDLMTTIKAIRIEKTGGPETMMLKEVELGAPKPGEITVRAKAIGINFIDTYHRSGLDPVPLPSGIGMEAAGIVEAVGEGVTNFKPGDRVAYASGPVGAYAEAHNVAAASSVKVPDGVSDEEPAALMLKGLT